jgi:hypothetical protein
MQITSSNDLDFLQLNILNKRDWDAYSVEIQFNKEGVFQNFAAAKSKIQDKVEALVRSFYDFSDGVFSFELHNPLTVANSPAFMDDDLRATLLNAGFEEEKDIVLTGNSRVFLIRQMVNLLEQNQIPFNLDIDFTTKEYFKFEDLYILQATDNNTVDFSAGDKLGQIYNLRESLKKTNPEKYAGRVGAGLLIEDVVTAMRLSGHSRYHQAVTFHESFSDDLKDLMETHALGADFCLQIHNFLKSKEAADLELDDLWRMIWDLASSEINPKMPSQKHLKELKARLKKEAGDFEPDEDDQDPKETEEKDPSLVSEMQRLRNLPREELNAELQDLQSEAVETILAIDPERYDSPEAIALHTILTSLIKKARSKPNLSAKEIAKAQKLADKQAKKDTELKTKAEELMTGIVT